MAKGFSLIELLVVLAIFAVMASMALISINHWQPTWKLAAASRSLTIDLRYAQQRAVTEQVKYSIFFSLEGNYYQIKRLGESPALILQKPLPNGVSFSSISGFTADEAVFNVFGAAETAGVVVLENTSQQIKTLNVRPSGSVKLQ